MKNKKYGPVYIGIGVMIAVLTAVTAGRVLAYLSSRAVRDNVILIGQNDSGIKEDFPDPGLVPEDGKQYVKQVQVENRQSVPCYIRAAVELGSSDSGFDVVLSGLNEEKWIYITEDESQILGGYFYFKDIVMPGKSTDVLFEGVSFEKQSEKKNVKCTEPLELIVYEESVQSEGHSSYLSAWKSFVPK